MKKGMKKVDWRESEARSVVPKVYKRGEREIEAESIIGKTAPPQKAFRSKAAEDGERVGSVWQPDDIGTENFEHSSGTAYLRNMDY